MKDTELTIVGNLVDSPELRNVGDSQVARFRVASNSTRYDATEGGWVDKNSLFMRIECWGNLAKSVAGSLAKGDPVVVHGELRTENWESDAGKRSEARVKATAVGPDLARCHVVSSRRLTAAAGAPEGSAPDDGTVDPATGEVRDPASSTGDQDTDHDLVDQGGDVRPELAGV